MSSSGRAQWQLSYEVSPIILTNGIAQNMPGGSIPIVSLTNNGAFNQGLLQSSEPDFNLDRAFARYKVMSGSQLIAQDFGRYPFANQQVAANSVIRLPLLVSLLMICPVTPDNGGYNNKLSVINSLKATLDKHNNSGGTYTIATPVYNYTNCLMRAFTDASDGESNQPQFQFTLDFEQPLLTLQDAAQAYNALMNKLSSGAAVDGDPPTWSGLSTSTGNPSANTTSQIIPAGRNLQGTSTSGIQPNNPTVGQGSSSPFSLGAP